MSECCLINIPDAYCDGDGRCSDELVPALKVSEHFAIHPALGTYWGWTVTHIGTGHAAGKDSLTRNQAIEMAEALEVCGDWTFYGTSDWPMECRAAAKTTHLELLAEFLERRKKSA